jgi:hypothetical protein
MQFLQVLYLKLKPRALAIRGKKALAELLDKVRLKNKNEVHSHKKEEFSVQRLNPVQ